MRILVLSSLAIMGLSVSASALADKPKSTTGIELGLRAGYAVPLGTLASNSSAPSSTPSGDVKLSDFFSGQIPFWFDAGYRIPDLYVGAFFQAGYLMLANNATTGCGQPSVTCSGNDLVFGANAHLHFVPGGPFDPWVGVGFGFEWANFSQSVGSVSGSGQLSGWQFVNLQLGADWAGANYGTGPFMAFSVGQYSSASGSQGSASFSGDIKAQTLHEWLTFGLRFAFDVAPGSMATTDERTSPD